MTRPAASFNVAHECALDPKWIVIGSVTSTPPSFVCGVWLAVMTHASAASPRGSTAGLDVEAIAAFNGSERAVVDAVVEQFRARGLIGEDGRLRAWAKRQGLRADRTNADRQKRYRDRKRDREAAQSPLQSPHKVTRVTRNAAPVTPSNERYEKGGDMGGVALITSSVTENLTTPNKRSSALAREDLIRELDQNRAGGAVGWTLWSRKHVDQLLQERITGEELERTVALARLKRQAASSSQPINVGFIASLLAEVRGRSQAPSGESTRSAASHSPEAPPDDPVATAIALVVDLYRLGRIDATERDRRIAEEKAKRREVTA